MILLETVRLQGFLYNPCKNPAVYDDPALSDIHISQSDAWNKTLQSDAFTYRIYCWGDRCLPITRIFGVV